MTTPNEARPEWEPVAELVFFRISYLGGEDRLPVLPGTAKSHVHQDLITRIDSLYGPAVHTEMLRAQEEARVLREAVENVKSDLWLQLEPKYGAKAASEYPSIVQANAALKGTP